MQHLFNVCVGFWELLILFYMYIKRMCVIRMETIEVYGKLCIFVASH